MSRRSNPAWTPALIAMAATAGVGVAGFGIGTYVRFKRVQKLRKLLLLHPKLLQQALATSTFKIPKLTIKPKTMETQLDEELRAFIVMGDLLCQTGNDMYRRMILSPNTFIKQNFPAWGREPGVPGQTGFLYSSVPPFLGSDADYSIGIWDTSPTVALTRARWMTSYALKFVEMLKELGQPLPPIGDGDGPGLGEVVEDYARDAAVSYLAAAIPGGVIVLAIADELGIGWTHGSGRQEIPPTCPDSRWRATLVATKLIAHAYANPAPAVIGTATVTS